MAFLGFIARTIAVVALMAAVAILVAALSRGFAGQPLDLAAPPDMRTVGRIGALHEDGAACRALLSRAGISYHALAPRGGGSCGYADGIAWGRGGARAARYDPARPLLACPLGVALAMWEWSVVQPAAARRLGTLVVGIDHYGSYACRRLHGRATGAWSAHASADALDIAGFRLADGRRVTVARDWNGDAAAAGFLRDVRDGACRLFATTLSPDYNAAHRDHLHLDEAARGGRRVCR